LIAYIDNLQAREVEANRERSSLSRKDRGNSDTTPNPIHPDRVKQVSDTREVSTTPIDLSEDQRCDNILDSAEQCLEESSRARNQWQRNRLNPLPSTKKQLKNARKIQRLQEARNKEAATRMQRLQDIRVEVKSKPQKGIGPTAVCPEAYSRENSYLRDNTPVPAGVLRPAPLGLFATPHQAASEKYCGS